MSTAFLSMPLDGGCRFRRANGVTCGRERSGLLMCRTHQDALCDVCGLPAVQATLDGSYRCKPCAESEAADDDAADDIGHVCQHCRKRQPDCQFQKRFNAWLCEPCATSGFFRNEHN